MGGILRSSTRAPPARKWLFKDKHLRPGSVCRNLPLGTSLVHRAQSPEQERFQLETTGGGGEGAGGAEGEFAAPG